MKPSSVFLGVVTVIVSASVFQMTFGWAAALAPGHNAFGFDAPRISGFPGRSARMTGGGAYDLPEFVHSGGGFRCLSDIAAGPFAGCLTGQGVRWDTAQLLESTSLKCTGAAAEPLKPAITGDHSVVLLADFYRQGDGNDESFTAQMVVADFDIAPDIAGEQNVWIQGIGCGTAIDVSFN